MSRNAIVSKLSHTAVFSSLQTFCWSDTCPDKTSVREATLLNIHVPKYHFQKKCQRVAAFRQSSPNK